MRKTQRQDIIQEYRSDEYCPKCGRFTGIHLGDNVFNCAACGEAWKYEPVKDTDHFDNIEPLPDSEVAEIEQLYAIYQRLKTKGWRRVSGNSRRDFYRKGRWICEVPASTIGRVKFWKDER